jgi:hypothetical protein
MGVENNQNKLITRFGVIADSDLQGSLTAVLSSSSSLLSSITPNITSYSTLLSSLTAREKPAGIFAESFANSDFASSLTPRFSSNANLSSNLTPSFSEVLTLNSILNIREGTQMAGTRGIARIRGGQLQDQLLRDNHFDAENKINENKINIDWLSHTEILDARKIDVQVQKNNVAVAGLSSIELTDIEGIAVASTTSTEGIVVGVSSKIRKNGTEDTPVFDAQGDTVYGKVREDDGTYYLDFYSTNGGTEYAYTFGETASNIDLVYYRRTNLASLPVDVLRNLGAGFVEGATDAKAYFNILQLAKDLGVTTNDTGEKSLTKTILEQIADEIQARTDADQDIRDDLSATTGAGLVGVVTDANYVGLTVQAVLSELASSVKDLKDKVDSSLTRASDSANGYFEDEVFTDVAGRFANVESVVDAELKSIDTRINNINSAQKVESYEPATDNVNTYNLVNGLGIAESVQVFINGAFQAPGYNFVLILNGDGKVTGLDFTGDPLRNLGAGKVDLLTVYYRV